MEQKRHLKNYIYVLYGLIGGVLWGIYTLCINRYYQTSIFKTYWKIDNLKELFSEAIVNNVICVTVAFAMGVFIWKFMWKKRARDFRITTKKHIYIVIINGLLSGTVATILYHLAVQFSGEVYASAIKTFYIPLGSLYSWIVFKNGNWKTIAGVIVATASLVFIGFLDSETEHVRSILVGFIGASGVALCWTAEAILTNYVLKRDKQASIEPAIFISYRQLVSLVGVIITCYILYPMLSHTSAIGSELTSNLFDWKWVWKISTDWSSIGWLVVGSAFNSASDFYYYWSFKGLAIPTATTMNNLDTPLGLFYTLGIIGLGLSPLFGSQSIPSWKGFILIFLLLIGSLAVILYDQNDFLEDEDEVTHKILNPNKTFMRYTVGLLAVFIGSYLYAYPIFHLDQIKQVDPMDSHVDMKILNKYENSLPKEKQNKIVSEIQAEDE